MKKASSKKTKPIDIDIRPEYAFSGGIRGKYSERLKKFGYTVRVVNKDGSFSEKRVLGEMVVVLEQDVWEHFQNSKAVNHALRTLISLVSKKKSPANKSARRTGKNILKTGD